MQRFDYIIVGGGAAGCVLANRLSADPTCRVLLLEAGGWDRSPFIRAPGGLLPIMMGGLYCWPYQTTPQVHLNDRVLYAPRGKVLGGGSSINGMVYCRGTPSDYDRWAALGNEGWSYAEVLPYFKKAENYLPGADAYHGSKGPLQVSRPATLHPLAQAWIEAGQQAGFPYNADTNGEQRGGFGPSDATVGEGRRSSSASAYVHPVRSRKNLEVLTGALTTQVLLQGTRAVGVRYVHRGRSFESRCEGEVILASGAINSPQLLMLSGIGDPEHLSQHGIAPCIDLPGVGQNLQDHLASSVKVACTVPISLYNYLNPIAGGVALGKYLLFRKGPLASSSVEAIAFVKSHPEAIEEDVKMIFAMALYQHNGREVIKQHGFFAHIDGVRPQSRGTVRLRSADPTAPPLLNPNFFATESDRRTLIEAVKISREVFAQKAFDRYRGRELAPGPDVRSDVQIEAYIRTTAEADYHSVGTCKMGRDPLAVVDARLRVHGAQALRVVDASIMPLMPGGNTNMPTVMVAEKGADLILGKSIPVEARAA